MRGKAAADSGGAGRGVAPGTLYVVATPIGNLEDITLRAIRVLKEVGLVAAEDTRVARKLFARYGIRTPVTSCFEHNELKKAPAIIERLRRGTDVALISDAGTPGFSDPGFRLIKLAVDSGITVTAVPGPAAPAAVLSVSGLPIDRFSFRGFVPQAGARRRRFLLEMLGTEETVVVFEAARRILKTLEDVAALLGDTQVVVAREMTKLHEEVLRGRASEVRQALAGRTLKGEITLVIRTKKAALSLDELRGRIVDFLSAGLPVKDVARALSRESGLSGAEVYKEALRAKEKLKR